ncbi:hypothetical protein D5041_06980 [Verminephrobacter aporrectodeae subsp. tuberculatae]|uniref:hypothetical protein n=1 Tax=Verminephrobacter aporrectodeae TaxID=1110389 RepID=UPI0022376EE7|nr:hypothetical protein [Verminephrobacter aporrectodeae]MCW5223348.1 hypothetical protein [Verminephrobacter aporrectodeae subsp. tuberculatae]MCW5288812.1 hypothetical protein [Verminephrobacter aporrectodeae subsp. tuberculatae]
MQQVTDLHELAAQLQAAQRDVDSARSVVAHDKQERAGSLAARLVDALTTTQPEAVLNAAQARLAEVTQKGRAAAREWIVETACQRLAEQAADAGQHRDQGQRLECVQARAGQVRRWLELAQEADSRLSDARRACESASTTELLDAVSKSKAISVLSCMSTSSAADLIMRAGQAVRALAEALPKHAEQASMDLPGDLCDLVVDLVFNPGFDVLSWFNVMRLGDAARQCK